MMMSFAVQKLFLLDETHLLIAGLNACAMGVLFRKSYLVPMSPSLFSTLFYQIQRTWSYVDVLGPFEFVLYNGIDIDLFSFFYVQFFFLSISICWRCYLFSGMYFWLLCQKNQVSISLWNYACTFYSILLNNKSIVMLIHYCFYYYKFVVHLGIWRVILPVFMLFFRIVVAIYPVFSVFPY